MGKLFLSENRFTPINIKPSTSGMRLGMSTTTNDLKVVLEVIEPDDVVAGVPYANEYDPYGYRSDARFAGYRANVLIGNKIAFSCTLLELNQLNQALSGSLNALNNRI